ncbi:acyl-CoA synthetase [Ferroplasma acidiphilum]|uniref:Acyl-CoA synthetase n=1 Tax=Ferroplasma acidiphilum TaxID=74969 RepID=A0A1V0N3X9_9ARCH|nr:fatty acyl-CoA synthetase [Ferroplasma acidiphilum]ARD84862.1 acyl-CoA synthetase [Ferroplasma acidiphilum]
MEIDRKEKTNSIPDEFFNITEDNIKKLRNRHNKIRRWVIADFLKRNACRYPEKAALIFNHPGKGEIKLTYPELEANSNRAANAFLNLGIQKYDRIAILAHNTLHHVLTIFGAAKAGGIYLALNYLMSGKDLAYCINHSEAKVLIVEDSLYDKIKGVLGDLKTVKTFIWSNQGLNDPPPDNKWLNFDELHETFSSEEPDIILNIEDPVTFTYTSGTEALPKAVVLSNESLISEYVGAIIDGKYNSDDINLNPMPIFHVAQRDVFVMPIFYIGGTNIMLTNPNPENILWYVDRYKPTILFLAPTVWISLLRYPDFDKYDFSSLTKCYYGASIFPEEPLKELMKKLPQARFYNYYGQTELAPYHTVANHEDILRLPKTAGRSGLNMQTRIEDANHNEIIEPGIPGEVTGRGAHVMLMYFKDPEKTEETFKHGWFHTGDIGFMGNDRYLEIADRKKDMIKTGGENVSSREVEEAIFKHPDISEVTVIGLPHRRWVEAVTAIVVPKPERTINPDEVIELCRKELSPFKVPKAVIVIKPDELPKSPSGKILKRDLRNTFANYYETK